MFWKRKRAATPPVAGCFGKLPATGDFIRLNAGGDELAAFDRWLGAGVDFARQQMGGGFQQAYQPSVGLFLFRGEGAKDEPPARGLAGAWAASGDSAGRLYPMVVFASYDYGELAATGAALPIALWPLLTACYELATQGRNMSVEQFLDRAGRMALPPLDDPEQSSAGYRAWLRTQPMKALWDTGFGTDASRFWVVQNILASLEPFRGQELPKTGLCLRLPLGAGDAYAASVWTDVTLRLGGWKQTMLNVFWTPQQTALLHIGPPHAASFRELIAPTGQADHVADLCGAPTSDEATVRRTLGALDAVVGRTDVTIAQFLEGLG